MTASRMEQTEYGPEPMWGCSLAAGAWHEGRRSPTSDTSGSGPGSPLLPPREDNEEEEAAAGQPLSLIRALSRSAAAGTQEDMEEENSIENRSGSLNAFLRTPSERRRWSGNARK